MRRLLYILPVLFISCVNERAEFDKDFRECISAYDYSDRIADDAFSKAINLRIAGKPVPDWEFTGLNGEKFSLHTINSPVVLVNFNVRRGEGYAFVAALHRWSIDHNNELFIIVNCMDDEETIRTMGRWSTSMPEVLKNPAVHIVPGTLEEDGEFHYINGVNDDDAVCSVYYISKDHKVAHYDPYGALIAWRNSVLYTNDPPETDYDKACDDFISERLATYLHNK